MLPTVLATTPTINFGRKGLAMPALAPTRTLRRLSIAAACTAATLTLAGCGSKLVDQASIENTAKEVVKTRYAYEASAVSCPDKLENRQGASTKCTATIYGDPIGVTMSVVEMADGNPKLDAALDPVYTPGMLRQLVVEDFTIDSKGPEDVQCKDPLQRIAKATVRCTVKSEGETFPVEISVDDQLEPQIEQLNPDGTKIPEADGSAATGEAGADTPNTGGASDSTDGPDGATASTPSGQATPSTSGTKQTPNAPSTTTS